MLVLCIGVGDGAKTGRRRGGLLQTGGLVVVMDVYARRPTAAPRMRQSLDRRGLMMMDGWMDGGRPGERGGTRSDGAILTTVIVGRQGVARPRLACRHVNSALCRVTRHWHGAWPGTTTWTTGIEKKKLRKRQHAMASWLHLTSSLQTAIAAAAEWPQRSTRPSSKPASSKAKPAHASKRARETGSAFWKPPMPGYPPGLPNSFPTRLGRRGPARSDLDGRLPPRGLPCPCNDDLCACAAGRCELSNVHARAAPVFCSYERARRRCVGAT